MGTYKEVFMAARRLPMRKIRDVLRLDAQGCPNRTIARSVGMGETTVRECLTRALRRYAGKVCKCKKESGDLSFQYTSKDPERSG